MSVRIKTLKTGVNQDLSTREEAVLELALKGLTEKEIGSTLGISPKTVAAHKGNIYKKRRVHSLLALASQTEAK